MIDRLVNVQLGAARPRVRRAVRPWLARSFRGSAPPVPEAPRHTLESSEPATARDACVGWVSPSRPIQIHRAMFTRTARGRGRQKGSGLQWPHDLAKWDLRGSRLSGVQEHRAGIPFTPVDAEVRFAWLRSSVSDA